jgi:hypothetical protein
MRIAQVVPAGELPGSGVLASVVSVAEALAKRGHQVSVWQLHEWDPAVYAPVRADRLVRLTPAATIGRAKWCQWATRILCVK